MLIPELLRDKKFVLLDGRTKETHKKGWTENPHTYDEAVTHSANGKNIGVMCGFDNLVVIDADCGHDSDFAKRLLQMFPNTFIVKTRRGYHFYLKIKDYDNSILKNRSVINLQKGGNKYGELRLKGAQVVCPPSIFEEKDKDGRVIAQHSYNVFNNKPDIEITIAQLEEVLMDFCSVSLLGCDKSIKPQIGYSIEENESLCSGIEYPPSYADKIATKCAFIRAFKDTGLEGNEPAWYHAMGVIRHCEDGEEKCHEYSAASKNEYDCDLTQQKIDNQSSKDIFPTTCTFLQQFGYCDNCPYKGKITSPIQLGIELTKLNDKLEDINEQRFKTRAKELIELSPNGKWHIGEQGIYRDNDEGVPELVCDVPFFIVDKLCECGDDETLITVSIRYFMNNSYHTFRLPLKHIADSKKLEGEFNGRGIFPSDRKNFKAYLVAYSKNISHIKPYKVITSLGWQSDGSFIYNSNGDGYSKDGDHMLGVLDSKIVSYIRGFKEAGTLEGWKEIFKYFKGDEFAPHLFSILCSLGAPLLTFTPAKGIALSFQGKSGSGKTVAHKAALSAYGNPDICGCIGTEDTHISTLGRFGAIKNMPLRLDEATLISPKRLSGLIYEVVNGRGRSRATKDGSLSGVTAEWQTLTLITTNRPLLEHEMNVIGEAERNRILEIEVPMPKDISHIGKKVGQIIEQNYGHVGKQLAYAFINHKEKILQMLETYQIKFQSMVGDDKRFWVACGAVAFTAGVIATNLNLIDVDLEAIEKWFVNIIKEQTAVQKEYMEEARGFSDLEEFVAALKDSLTGSILVLNEDGVVCQTPQRETLARIIKVNGLEASLFVRAPVLKAFIKKHYISGTHAVKKDLGIGESVCENFSGLAIRGYRFLLST